jgi:hypothetical protein
MLDVLSEHMAQRIAQIVIANLRALAKEPKQ